MKSDEKKHEKTEGFKKTDIGMHYKYIHIYI